jgi:hypothetical protein
VHCCRALLASGSRSSATHPTILCEASPSYAKRLPRASQRRARRCVFWVSSMRANFRKSRRRAPRAPGTQLSYAQRHHLTRSVCQGRAAASPQVSSRHLYSYTTYNATSISCSCLIRELRHGEGERERGREGERIWFVGRCYAYAVDSRRGGRLATLAVQVTSYVEQPRNLSTTRTDHLNTFHSSKYLCLGSPSPTAYLQLLNLPILLGRSLRATYPSALR